MIYLIHQNNKSLKILDNNFQEIAIAITPSITETLFIIAKTFPDDFIIWCHQAYFEFINVSDFPNIFHHKYILASFTVSNKNYIPNEIEYIDQSIFLNVKKDVRYPTWLMSSDIGGVNSELLLNISKDIIKFENFDYFLNSLAKNTMPQGVFCYSEPKLFKNNPTSKFEIKPASNHELFKFVKQHYKWVWVYILLLSHLIFEKKLLVLAFFNSIFYKRIQIKFANIQIKSSKKVITKKEIDVIIPTIGRKAYLYDVLKDLSNQTLLPKNVIIIEQNPNPESISELNYLSDENWPFQIKHTFTHQTGACNARNLALKIVQSEWVFFNDDDNRFDANLIYSVFEKLNQFGISALTTAYLQEGEKIANKYKFTHQTGIFGAGNSFLKSSEIKNVYFNMALEFGYGEDFDFGMQLRNKGIDVVYFPDVSITHLKAPIGGFRTEIKQLWDAEVVQPKPSPTIMYNLLQHYTKKQVLSYKLVLFFRLLKKESLFNYIKFFKEFQQKWEASQFWANKLG